MTDGQDARGLEGGREVGYGDPRGVVLKVHQHVSTADDMETPGGRSTTQVVLLEADNMSKHRTDAKACPIDWLEVSVAQISGQVGYAGCWVDAASRDLQRVR